MKFRERIARAAWPLWVGMATAACFVGQVFAQDRSGTLGSLSGEFIVGSILTIGLTAVGAFANRIDNNQKQARADFLECLKEIKSDFNARHKELADESEKCCAANEHEQKQLQTQINLLRELVFKDYPNRTETEKHRDKVEGALEAIHARLNALNVPKVPTRRGGDTDGNR